MTENETPVSREGNYQDNSINENLNCMIMKKKMHNSLKRFFNAMGKNWMESMRYYSYSI